MRYCLDVPANSQNWRQEKLRTVTMRRINILILVLKMVKDWKSVNYMTPLVIKEENIENMALPFPKEVLASHFNQALQCCWSI